MKKKLQLLTSYFSDSTAISNQILMFIFLGIFAFPVVTNAQTAAFTPSTISTCSPASVTFTDNSVGASSWNWNFGNSNTSTSQNPSASYPSPGLYTVKLTINGGGSANLESTQKISVYPAPKPTIPTLLTGCEPYTGALTVVCNPVVVAPFSISGTPVEGITGGAIVSYTFDFLGLIPTVTQASPILNVSNIPAGNYSVLVTATDANGCKGSIFKLNAITVNPKPTADFTFIKSNQCGLGNVTFTGTSAVSSGTIAGYAWLINGVNVGTTKDLTYNFTASGTYTIDYIVATSEGCTSNTVTKQVIFNNNNAFDFTTIGNCVGQTVAFTATGTNVTKWSWDFNNSGAENSTIQNPSFTYNSTGTKTAKLTVTFSDGCVQSTTHDIIVSGGSADFNYSTTAACAPTYTVNFTSTSTVSSGTITGYDWDFGDATAHSTLPNPTHNYNAAGTFPVKLTITTSDGCTNSKTTNVVVTPGTINFTASLKQGCSSLSTTFTPVYANASDPIISYNWDFGDASSSTAPSPSHTYTSTGKYNVSLTVTTTNGCTITKTIPQMIKVGTPQPISDITFTQATYCNTNAVSFTASITALTDSLVWNFNDGSGLAQQNVSGVTSSTISHTYSTPGPKSVTLQAWYNGCPSTVNFTKSGFTINEPTASFTPSSTVQCSVPTANISFTNNSISNPANTTWDWDFGDGSPHSNLQNPSHVYTTTGNFIVTLLVSNSATGCSDQATSTIYVTTSNPTFTANNTITCAGNAINFNNQTVANSSPNFTIASYLWTFGDGQTSTAVNPTHTYTTPGLYTVKLDVTGTRGCVYTTTRTNYIDVRGPIVNFSSNAAQICIGAPVTFTDATTKVASDPASSNTYYWTFGDGENSTDKNPVHTYATSGNFTVTLQVTDNLGCISSKSITSSVVVPQVTAGFTTSRSIYCASASNINFTNSAIGNIVSYDWDMDGDGTFEIINGAASQSRSFPTVGDFTIKQRITSNLGCQDVFSKTISIVDGTGGIVLVNPILGCAPANAQLQATDPAAVVSSYLWDFGDGQTSTLRNPNHFYLTPGNYTAQLTVTLTGGCTKSTTQAIHVDGAVGTFTYDNTPGCAPHTETFHADNLSSVSELTWDFGDGTTQTQTVGVGVTSMTVNHTYTTYGSNLPSLILRDASCGDYSYYYGTNKRINTSIQPIANFNFTTVFASGQNCQNLSFQFTDTSVKQDPRYAVASWSWDFGDGQTSTLQNPTHTYINPGNYTVTLISGNNFIPGGCNSAPVQKTVTVNPLPVATTPLASQDFCSGNSSPSVVVSSTLTGTTFDWSRNTPAGITTSQPTSGTGIAIGGSIPSAVFTNTTTTPITITYTITPIGPVPTFCIGNTITANIVVNPTPTINSAASKTICDNALVGYNITSATTGTTFAWTSSILTAPIGGTISGNSSGSGASLNEQLDNTGTSSGVIRYVITPTGPTGCPGTPFNFDVTVNPTPIAIATPVATTICNATATNIALSTTTTGAVTYSWTAALLSGTSTGGFSTSSGSTIAQTLTNTSTSPAVVRYTITPAIGTCTGSPITVDITVNPSGQVNQPTNQVICNSSSTTLVTFGTTNTGGTTTYTWTNTNTSIGLAATGTGDIPSFTATNGGTTQATATIVVTPTFTNGGASCTGTTKTFTIRVNPTGQVNQPANVTYCPGSRTVTYTSTNTDGTRTYSWTNDNTAIGLPANGTTPATGLMTFTATNSTTAPITANIVVTPIYTNGGVSCSGPSKSFTITINPTGQVNNPGNQTLCNNTATTAITFGTINTGGTTTYTWVNNNTSIGLAASSGGNSTGIPSFTAINNTSAPITATITVTPTFTNGGSNCAGTNQIFTITVNPTPTVNSVATKTICDNALVGYNITSATTGTTFAWTSSILTTPTGGTINGNSSGSGASLNEQLDNTGSSFGVVRYVITPTGPTGCSGTPFNFDVTVNPTPIAIATPVATTICNATATNIALSTTTTGAVTYSWTAALLSGTSTGGFSASSGSTIAQILTNTSTSPAVVRYTITPAIGTCTGSPITVDITVNPSGQVNQPTNQVICNSSSTTLVTFGTTNTGGTTTYTWTNTNTSIGLAATGTGDIPSFTATNGGTTQATATIVVTPTFTNGGASCTGTTKTFTIRVNPTGQVNQPANVTYCPGSRTVTYTSTNTDGTRTYSWTNDNTAIGLPANGTTPATGLMTFTATNSTTAPITANIVVTPIYTNGGVSCSGPSKSFTITINPTGQVNNPGNQTLCNNTATTAITFGTINTGGTTTYTWVNNNTSIGLAASSGGNSTGIPSFTAINNTSAPITATITVTPTFTNGGSNCAGTNQIFTITVNPTPTVNSVATKTICDNALVGYNITSATTGTTFAWTSSILTTPTGGTINGNSSDSGASLNEQLDNTGSSFGVVRYVITPTGPTGCSGTPFNFDVTVNPTPIAIATPVATTICNATATNIALSTTTTGAVTYSWTAALLSGTSTGGFSASSGSTIAQILTNTSTSPAVVRYTITPAIGTCTGSPITVDITVNPSGQVNQPTNQVICNSSSTTLVTFGTTNTGGTTTYTWTNTNTSIGLAATGTGDIPSFTATNGGTTQATATIVVTPTFTNGGASCTGTTKTFTIRVNPTGQVNQPANVTYCPGSRTVTYTSTNTDGTRTYSWTNDNTAIGLPANGTTPATGLMTFTATNSTTAPITANIVVTPIYTNGGVSCSGPSKSFTITINPTGQVNNPGNQTLCNNTATTAITFGTINTGGTTTYTWVNNNTSIGLAASSGGNSTGIPSFTAINNTSAPITATITVTPTFTNGGSNCAGTNQIFTITVNPTPNVNSVATKTICDNALVGYNITSATTGTTFAWTSSILTTPTGGTINGNSSGSGASLNEQLDNTGSSFGVVRYVITPTGPTGCSGTPFNFDVTVNPTPIAIATPAATTICNATATNIALSTTTTGAVTYSWTAALLSGTSTGGFSASSGSTIAQILTNTSTSPAVVRYTITPAIGTCTGSAITVDITVNPTPDAIATPAAQTICNGAATAIALSTNTTGATVNYTWTAALQSGTATGFSASSGNSIAQTLTNSTNAPAVVRYTITPAIGTCTGSAITVDITVNPTPDAIATPAAQTICNGAATAIALSTNTTGATVNYTWTAALQSGTASGFSASSGNSIAQTLTNSTNAPAVVRYTITPAIGTCTGSAITVDITVNPTPDAIATPTAQTICNGAATAIALSTNTTGATVNYTWTAALQSGTATGFSASSGNSIAQTLTNSTNAPAVVRYTITPAIGTCTGSVITVDITVNPTPDAIATPAAQTICNGAATAIALSTNTTGATVNYTWTAALQSGTASGFSASSGNSIAQTLTNSTNAPAVVRYTITPAIGTCTGSAITVDITVNPTPDAIATPTAQTICNGAATAIALSTNTTGATVNYTWTAALQSGTASGFSASSGNSIAQTLTNSTNAPAVVRYTITPAIGTCTGSVITVDITVNPTPDAIATPTAQTICNGAATAIALSTNTTGATVNYTWTAALQSGTATGFSASSGNSIAQTLTNSTNAPAVVRYTITPAIGTCTGSAITVDITVNPTPDAIATPTAQTICNGAATAIALSTNTTGATVNYTWTAALQSGTASGFSASSGNSIAQTLTNSTNAPAVVRYTITPAIGTCTGSAITVDITVNPTPDAIATPAAQTICNGAATAIALSTNTTGATVNYTWTAALQSGTASGFSASSGNSIAQTLTNSTNAPAVVRYTITPAIGTCTGSVITVDITVNPTPDAIATPTAQTICNGAATAIALSTNTTGATVNYTWTAALQSGTATGFSASSGNSIAQTLTNSTNAPAVVRYTITPAIGTCTGSAITVDITVNPTPDAIATPAAQTICNGAATAIALSTNTTGATVNYTWTAALQSGTATGFSASSGNSIAQTLTNSTNAPAVVRYTITPAIGTCTGSAITVDITVNPTPDAIATPTAQTICNGAATAIALSTNTTGATVNYTWTAALQSGTATGFSASSGNSIAQTLTNSTNAPAVVRYTITPAIGTCTGSAITVDITVNPTPDAIATPTAQTICNGAATAIALSTNTTGATVNYTWTAALQSGTATGFSASSGNSIAQTLTNSTNAPAVVRYTITPAIGTCTGSAITVDITVNPTPDAIATPTAQTICNGAATAIALSTNTTGATVNYTWTAALQSGTATGFSASSGNSIAQTLTNSTNAPAVVRYTITPAIGTCTGSVITVDITVNPTPDAIATPAAQTICNGAATAIALSTNTTGATVNYTWTAALQSGTASGFSASSGNSIAQTLTNSTNAPAVVRYTITPAIGTCTGSVITVDITVNPTPDAIATPTAQTICNGTATAIALSTNTTGATVNYTWTAALQSGTASGFSASSGNSIAQTLTNSTNAPAVVRYTITPAIGTCTGSAITVDITVNPTPSLSIDDVSLLEANTNAKFKVSLSKPTVCDVTFTVNTQNGIAIAPLDYTSIVSADYTIPAGETSIIINVPINDDNAQESLETYSVIISNPTNATISDSQGLGSIIDNDGILNPDNGTTFVNVPLTGNVSTNDVVPVGITYGNPAANPTNPSTCAPVIAASGAYTFVCATPGEYTFLVPVCEPAPSTSCTNVPLTIMVLDPTVTTNGPVASPDYTTTLQNTAVTIDVRANDRCQNGPLCTLSTPTVVTAPANGTFNPTTGLYTPNSGFVGKDSLQYSVCDNQAIPKCDQEWAYITVLPIGTPNSTNATDDYLQTPYGTPATGNVKTNDRDPEGNTQTVTAQNTTVAGKGTLVLNTDGTFTFTPAIGFSGPVDFVYTTCDNGTPVACATATLHVLVDVNIAPVAVDNFGSVNEDGVLNGPNLLTNDTDFEGNLLTINTTPIIGTSHGTLVINPNGTYIYTPNANYNGNDSFVYQICDDGIPSKCDTASVFITILPVNDPPVGTALPQITPEDTPISGTIIVSDIDGDVLTVAKTTDPTHGTVIVNSDGTYTYTPNTNYNGNDSFTVTVSDGKGGTAVVTVLITVTPQNDVPIAVNDSESMFEDEVLTSTLSINDILSGDGGNTWTIKTNPSHGTVVVNIDGTFTYTPNLNYNGTDSFTYTIKDLDGDTTVGTVTILVKGKPELTKSASKPTMNNDGTYSWKYTIVVNNDTNQQLDEVQVEDNLDDVFLAKGCTYKVTSITATGGLMSNGLYNGSSIINTLDQNQSLPANKKDSIIIEVRVDTHRQADTITVYNQAIWTCKQLNERFNILSDAISSTSPLDPTQTDIPEVTIYIPDGFSPNDDPLNQTFVITHSVTTKIDFEVFNRWGNSVYKNRDYQNDWNGKGTGNFLGKDLPNGTYYCVCKVIKLSNNEVVFTGVKYITLRR